MCSHPEPPRGIEGAHILAELVPADADLVVYSGSLTELINAIDQVSRRTPLAIPPMKDLASWVELGAALDAPALAYWSHGQLAVAMWADHESGANVEEAWSGSLERREVDPGMRRGEGWREYSDGSWTSFASTDSRRIVVGWPLREGVSSLDTAIWELGENHRAVGEEKKELLELTGAQESVVHGVIRGNELVRGLSGEGRAAFLRNHLAEQLGEVYFSVSLEEEGEKLTLDLLTPGGTSLPMIIDGLGSARGELPALGGLARPGILGMIRLSADPEQILQLIRMMLAPEERGRLDGLLTEMREELLIDVEKDILQNITGQIAVVFYGLEDSFFDREGVDLVASLIRLQSTREAVLVPFDDRERMEEIFNIFTQLSRGSLRRQVIRHTVQYAWFDDGALLWAVIMNDDHLLFVDSAVAFDHASAWERSPGQMGGALDERDVAGMMESDRGMAAYLDLSTIRSVIDQGGMPDAAEWLESLDAIKVQMDVDGRRDRSRIEVWSTRRAMEKAGEDAQDL